MDVRFKADNGRGVVMSREISGWNGSDYWRVETDGAVDYYPRLPGETLEDFEASLAEKVETRS